MINNSGQGKYKHSRVRILTTGETVYTDCERKADSRAKRFCLGRRGRQVVVLLSFRVFNNCKPQ